MDLVIFNENEEEVIEVMELAKQYGLKLNQKIFGCTLLHKRLQSKGKLFLGGYH